MKYKKLLIRLFVVFFILIAGYNLYFHFQLNRHENVLMTYVEDTAHSEGVSVILLNNTLDNIYSGAPYILRLQRQVLGVWLPVWPNFTTGYTEELYCYSPNIKYHLDLSWNSLYGAKAPGHYRVIKEFRIKLAPGDYEKFFLSAAFTIPHEKEVTT